ncbi:MAG: hypothetical protein WCO89_00175 [Syntrophus sp. (in: bacteria)]
MKIEARIVNYTVLRDSISVQLLFSEKDIAIAGILASIQDKTEHFKVGNIDTTGVVKSVGLRKDIRLLLHLPCTEFVALNLFSLMVDSGDTIPFAVNTPQEVELLCLLDKASIIKSKSPQGLLRELTAFTGKNGKQVPGKDSICDLSLRHQEVVLSKLQRIVKTAEEGRSC